MAKEFTIPEMLGFPPVPFEREKPYSVQSYQAMYVLTEEEASEIRDKHRTHDEIDRELGLRFVSDVTYRRKVSEAMHDITATEPDEDVKRIMARLEKTMKRPEGVA